ncbi:NAD(P)/FAD-dependent oxidoreductase [Nocardia cyriacigeorgica]|uniref:NAD(P)/FAD-dependent oxidoreductase n=1 Tax=Nocardia cyriacigeorgica TaxID=135487 RepID=UPI0018942509|nr:FAD-dependent oxidoreductase [Nocardia cyriacigeorgica]MBF6440246.1 FAD-dependent oxidoreductase [Nocardia cyriacigeorgica]
MTETYVVVGASLAGARAAETLRAEGFEGRIVLVGNEFHLPYDRPPLSKEVILGRKEPEQTHLHPAEFYANNDIELLLGVRMTRLAPSERRVELDSGAALRADKVLLCTGTAPRRPDIAGLDVEGVHFLRTVDDAIAIRDRLRAGGSVVIVGGGLIGMELAASAVSMGNAVTVLEREAGLLRRVLGAQIGDRLARWHSERGVCIRTGAEITGLSGKGRVRQVHTADGAAIDADLVVIGIGVTPAVDAVAGAGIDIENGIVVDEFGETSVPGIYAAGDVACRADRRSGRRIRLEHWQNAQNQGIAAARAMLGRRESSDEVPWFWSDQGEVNIQAAGHMRPTDAVVWRGEPESMEFTAFHLHQGLLAGVVGVNRRREVRMAMSMIGKQARPDPALLADPAVDLRGIGDSAVRTRGA